MAEDNLIPDPGLTEILEAVADKKRAGAGIRAMQQRESEFSSRFVMLLAGAAMVAEARDMVDDALTEQWTARPEIWDSKNEVVIGAGFHAAVYCAARVRAGFPRPVVLDRAPAAYTGGTFAMTRRPAFCLNSENRPGRAGYPADGDALNYLPGGIIQPSQISAREFPDNALMRWVIRVTLAQFARVYAETDVTSVKPAGAQNAVALSALPYEPLMYASRVIDARGMGDEKDTEMADGKRILTFRQLMSQADKTFPFRGMSRVAVVGGGDSGRCAVEALTGIGPDSGMRTAELDGTPRIDWYALKLPLTNNEWRQAERGRYARIGSYLPRTAVNRVSYEETDYNGDAQDREDEFTYTLPDYHDVTVIRETAGNPVSIGTDVLLNGRSYSHVVLCTGSRRKLLTEVPCNRYVTAEGSRAIAAQCGNTQIYAIGPAANIPFDNNELSRGLGSIPANAVAMFRLGGRTAQLAAILPDAGS